LFIVSAHPDRDILPLSSANKLQGWRFADMTALVENIDKYSSALAFSQEVSNDNPRLGSLLAEHKIDQNDLQNYWYMARNQKFSDDHKP
jgi:hypothetical protein